MCKRKEASEPCKDIRNPLSIVERLQLIEVCQSITWSAADEACLETVKYFLSQECSLGEGQNPTFVFARRNENPFVNPFNCGEITAAIPQSTHKQFYGQLFVLLSLESGHILCPTSDKWNSDKNVPHSFRLTWKRAEFGMLLLSCNMLAEIQPNSSHLFN